MGDWGKTDTEGNESCNMLTGATARRDDATQHGSSLSVVNAPLAKNLSGMLFIGVNDPQLGCPLNALYFDNDTIRGGMFHFISLTQRNHNGAVLRGGGLQETGEQMHGCSDG